MHAGYSPYHAFALLALCRNPMKSFLIARARDYRDGKRLQARMDQLSESEGGLNGGERSGGLKAGQMEKEWLGPNITNSCLQKSKQCDG